MSKGTKRMMRDTYRGRHVSTGNTFNGGIEIIKRLALNNLSAYFASNTELGEATLDGDQSKT